MTATFEQIVHFQLASETATAERLQGLVDATGILRAGAYLRDLAITRTKVELLTLAQVHGERAVAESIAIKIGDSSRNTDGFARAIQEAEREGAVRVFAMLRQYLDAEVILARLH